MATYTPNHDLKKPAPEDFYNVADQNGNMDKIDLALASMVPKTQKGAAGGVAELGSDGKVPAAQLPSYVDDTLEYETLSAFPATGESGKIYVALDSNKTYRWSGSAYVEISASLALGETSFTAYRADRGKTAYDHSQTTGNPHGTTAAQVGAYTKEEDLSAAVKTLLGLPASATPSDAFTKIDALLKVKPFVTGTYTGNGGGQSINLGFQPAIVIVFQYGFITSGNAIYGGLAVPGVPLANNGVTAIKIDATGFSVYTNGNSIHCNDSGAPYTYIAFK